MRAVSVCSQFNFKMEPALATFSGQTCRLVFKDCYKILKTDLGEEVVDHVWTKKWITDEERIEIKSNQNPLKRNENLINFLMTK